MRSVFKILAVGLIWAGLDACVLVFSVLLLGTVQTSTHPSTSLVGPSTILFTAYSFGPLPNFPIGWFLLLIAFGAGFVLADVAERHRGNEAGEIPPVKPADKASGKGGEQTCGP